MGAPGGGSRLKSDLATRKKSIRLFPNRKYSGETIFGHFLQSQFLDMNLFTETIS